MTTDKEVGAPYQIKGFPTIKFFGMQKSKPVDYNQARTASKMSEFALSQLSDVISKRLGTRVGSSGSN